MAEHEAAEPALYGVSTAEGLPGLHARSCRGCGHVFFPPQDYGCERCGARPDRIESVELTAGGTVVAATRAGQDPVAGGPATVATIVLDAGPTIGALLVPGTDPATAPPGSRVAGVLVERGSDLVELRFAPVVSSDGDAEGSPTGEASD